MPHILKIYGKELNFLDLFQVLGLLVDVLDLFLNLVALYLAFRTNNKKK